MSLRQSGSCSRVLINCILLLLVFIDMRRDVQEIFKMTPHDKQVMMFSATQSKEIKPVCKKFMQDVIFCQNFKNLSPSLFYNARYKWHTNDILFFVFPPLSSLLFLVLVFKQVGREITILCRVIHLDNVV